MTKRYCITIIRSRLNKRNAYCQLFYDIGCAQRRISLPSQARFFTLMSTDLGHSIPRPEATKTHVETPETTTVLRECPIVKIDEFFSDGVDTGHDDEQSQN